MFWWKLLCVRNFFPGLFRIFFPDCTGFWLNECCSRNYISNWNLLGKLKAEILQLVTCSDDRNFEICSVLRTHSSVQHGTCKKWVHSFFILSATAHTNATSFEKFNSSSQRRWFQLVCQIGSESFNLSTHQPGQMYQDYQINTTTLFVLEW